MWPMCRCFLHAEKCILVDPTFYVMPKSRQDPNPNTASLLPLKCSSSSSVLTFRLWMRRRSASLAVEESCRGEIMSPPASEESVVTVGGSRCFLGDDAAATSTGQSAEWTNEKHCLYIGSLERSFVEQLQRYKMSSGGGRTRKTPRSLLELPSSFDEVMPGTRLHRNQPFTSLQKISKEVRVPRNSTSPRGLEGPSVKQPVGGITEYSDQNFVEEYEEEPKYAPISKRLKRSKVDAAANAQVVPT